jgi:hypothetical protein
MPTKQGGNFLKKTITWLRLSCLPYIKRNKNDAADAEAICEAVTRPTMRFVAVKTAE